MESSHLLLTRSCCCSFSLQSSSSSILHFPTSLPFRFRRSQTNSSINSSSLPDATSPIPLTKVAATDLSLEAMKKAADLSPELKGSSIFLVGMKSSFKTNLGKLLADVLRYYYFDSDNLVEEAVGGASVAKSLKESDEAGFNDSETEVLKQLSSMGRLVVCAGNGAVQNNTNLALLRHGITLWIDLPLDIVARDVTENQIQFPSFEISTSGSYPEVMDELGAIYDEYKSGYAAADAIISLQKVASQLGYDNIDDITIEDVTLEVLGEIEKLTRVKKMIEEAARPF
ncbi:probable inactive shikimate kinase like 1, chloroplastic isoform X2 [Lathyrus oleraceus]|uniref:probable inactive shikimate kinase like 1, chloroplastic isoform X2 n=1 Tax=Pisum sativum TaxID=3888 RepID=UPI0021D01E02|nr:probable inactive shikimate kinase like 1, chloroplastic isoform X2 [Pisum sativum]